MTLAILNLSGTCEFSKDRFMIWEIGLESMLLHAMMSLGDILLEPADAVVSLTAANHTVLYIHLYT